MKVRLMDNSSKQKLKIDIQILVINKLICSNIEMLDFSKRGHLSQNILKSLRDFIEHIMVKIHANGKDVEISWDRICNAVEYVKTRGELNFLSRLHKFLQCSVSHYTPDEENAERLMLKYYEYLLRTKIYLSAIYNLETLENIDKFPLNTDTDLYEYYEKIANRINRQNKINQPKGVEGDRLYIQKIKPFFVNKKVYYEVTFIPATGKASKFDSVIAFTSLDISKYYAVKLSIFKDSIEIIGKKMTILIINNWETSIRPCEITKLSNIFNQNLKNQGGTNEYRGLMQYLSKTSFSLVEILNFNDLYYMQTRERIIQSANAKVSHIFNLLDKCRELIKKNKPGCNVLNYLLYGLNNRIIWDQIDDSNNLLSNLCLSNKCIPFDKMPFNTSLVNHNPKLGDLFECFDSSNRQHELLARFIKNNAEVKEQLYTPISELVGFDNIDLLIRKYNCELYRKHTNRRILNRNNHLYIKEYEDDTVFIIKKLIATTESGIQNYTSSVNVWISSGTYLIDCDEKKTFIQQMFENSMVTLIYGAAGTGKSYLINHISHYFSKESKLYLANTNPAVNNLKRRVDASNCEFMTVAKFLGNRYIKTDYDLLIIDECSTLNNRDMKEILNKATFEALILVGDVYQIESIRFGNWFSAARSFLPKTSVFELKKPHRTNDEGLLELWERVRSIDDNNTVLELITDRNYSTALDATIFNTAEEDEIILCLNYGGLYGINNINRLLQESNNNPTIAWGIQYYKVGDPILFNESERFNPLIYNNMKGTIVGISSSERHIVFDIEMDIIITGLEARNYDFDLLSNSTRGNSVIRFKVNKHKTTDEDDDVSSAAVVPFQVAYAVSIHKAQGLEYNSVKIVISDEVDDLVTHNVFYTAITRTREHLKIYWSPEVENRVLGRIKPKKNDKDVTFLKQIIKNK